MNKNNFNLIEKLLNFIFIIKDKLNFIHTDPFGYLIILKRYVC